MTETNPQVQEAPPELDLLRRERADFLNYKRRIAAERIDDRERARQDLIRDLLPAIDDLDRAMTHLPAQLGAHPWVKGVELARERFLDTLRRLGVERIGAQGEHSTHQYTTRLCTRSTLNPPISTSTACWGPDIEWVHNSSDLPRLW